MGAAGDVRVSWLLFEAEFRARQAMKQVGLRLIPEPLAHRLGRILCTRFDMHGISCRGRNDHMGEARSSWHPALKRWYL